MRAVVKVIFFPYQCLQKDIPSWKFVTKSCYFCFYARVPLDQKISFSENNFLPRVIKKKDDSRPHCIFEIEACLLLTFFICLDNQLSFTHSIKTYIRIQMLEKGDSSNRQKVNGCSFHEVLPWQNLNWFLS